MDRTQNIRMLQTPVDPAGEHRCVRRWVTCTTTGHGRVGMANELGNAFEGGSPHVHQVDESVAVHRRPSVHPPEGPRPEGMRMGVRSAHPGTSEHRLTELPDEAGGHGGAGCAGARKMCGRERHPHSVPPIGKRNPGPSGRPVVLR